MRCSRATAREEGAHTGVSRVCSERCGGGVQRVAEWQVMNRMLSKSQIEHYSSSEYLLFCRRNAEVERAERAEANIIVWRSKNTGIKSRTKSRLLILLCNYTTC